LQFIFFPKWIRLETKALVSEYEMELILYMSINDTFIVKYCQPNRFLRIRWFGIWGSENCL